MSESRVGQPTEALTRGVASGVRPAYGEAESPPSSCGSGCEICCSTCRAMKCGMIVDLRVCLWDAAAVRRMCRRHTGAQPNEAHVHTCSGVLASCTRWPMVCLGATRDRYSTTCTQRTSCLSLLVLTALRGDGREGRSSIKADHPA